MPRVPMPCRGSSPASSWAVGLSLLLPKPWVMRQTMDSPPWMVCRQGMLYPLSPERSSCVISAPFKGRGPLFLLHCQKLI